jgi:hypothetical protein
MSGWTWRPTRASPRCTQRYTPLYYEPLRGPPSNVPGGFVMVKGGGLATSSSQIWKWLNHCQGLKALEVGSATPMLLKLFFLFLFSIIFSLLVNLNFCNDTPEKMTKICTYRLIYYINILHRFFLFFIFLQNTTWRFFFYF